MLYFPHNHGEFMKKITLFLALTMAFQFTSANMENNPELERKAQLASAAFSCAVLNGWVENESERKRLIEVGLANGKDVAKVIKSDKFAKIMNYESFSEDFLLGVIVGSINASATDEARKKIFDGATTNEEIQKLNAYVSIRDQNCNIIK